MRTSLTCVCVRVCVCVCVCVCVAARRAARRPAACLQGTVVDSSLRVLNVASLRVADASVMPDIVSGNTQVPSAAIGLQMARILKEQHS